MIFPSHMVYPHMFGVNHIFFVQTITILCGKRELVRSVLSSVRLCLHRMTVWTNGFKPTRLFFKSYFATERDIYF